MRPLARLAQFENGPPGQHLAPVPEKTLEHLFEVQQAWLPIDQGDHVHAEGILQLRLLVQAVEHHFSHFATLQLDHHTHARFVGLVAQIGNAVDLLLVDQLAEPFEQRSLVHLVRQFVDDDRLTIVALLHLLEVHLATHDDAPAPGAIALADPGEAVDDAGGRKVGCRQQIDQLVDADLGVAEQREAGIDHFTEVVWRNVGRHADRDPRRAVDQEVRNARRHDQRLFLRTVVVGSEIDGFLVDVGEQFVPDTRHAHFGVTHRSRIVAVDRTEVALSINQHVAQREILRHAHDGVVDRRVAMRMVPDREGFFGESFHLLSAGDVTSAGMSSSCLSPLF
ncbi:MAG: hypothetical protein AW09_002740 [Candidatus Accumulibacter phosphatis]|uniref:Uncharacterized protein n=1 Tax=Candidatus Accumulibacter phosphatis TaxID=327160 RepID=A0A080LUA3_9PROT|nr:MAG: hypothetical protein AW09_002740 [Candidatus Accumulibacter phosphatis]